MESGDSRVRMQGVNDQGARVERLMDGEETKNLKGQSTYFFISIKKPFF